MRWSRYKSSCQDKACTCGVPMQVSRKSDTEGDNFNDVSVAHGFHEAIKEKAELSHVSGNIILSFEEILVLTPRDHYGVDMFPDYLLCAAKRMITRLCIQAHQDYSFYQKTTSIFSSWYAPFLF